jgi:hypothetical protein
VSKFGCEAAHVPVIGSRTSNRHRSTTGNKLSTGAELIRMVLASDHDANMVGAAGRSVTFPLTRRALRYGAILSLIITLISALSEAACGGHVKESMQESNLVIIASTEGTCVNKIGARDVLSISGNDSFVCGCATRRISFNVSPNKMPRLTGISLEKQKVHLTLQLARIGAFDLLDLHDILLLCSTINA